MRYTYTIAMRGALAMYLHKYHGATAILYRDKLRATISRREMPPISYFRHNIYNFISNRYLDV